LFGHAAQELPLGILAAALIPVITDDRDIVL
jgi:hypothetical protein